MDATTVERALVLRAQSGDRGAFDELLQTVDKPLLRYLSAIVRDRCTPEDVLQEVLITIVRKLVWLRDPSLFRAWSFRIASRAAFRAMKNEPLTEAIEEHASVTVEPPDPWLRERLAEALPHVTNASRAVIHLHYFEELSISDVAAAIEISTGTVKSRLAYGLKQLRKELT
ncbi:MAG TPA: RNA polymerase sigma factor [Thermoanaerobaculia bacterium]|nr:RNA polymerase sigma factor [Thermoanaerobaculia bacterium]